jgi:pyridoxamine 5'-phosphate oxidase
MPHVLIVHEVADYPAWKTVFDDAAEMRHAAGERSYQVLGDETDANLVVHFSEWTTLAAARAFFESPRLVEIREQAGVKAPEFHYLVEREAGRLGDGAAAVEHPDGLAARLRTLDVFAGELPRFAVDEAPSDPADLFVEWLEEAIAHGVPEPHAMVLSTVDGHGRPNARVLILKGIVDGKWRFASSALSVKGEELTATGVAALTFYWPQRGRQIRVRGSVAPADPDVSAQDFFQRSPAARAEALGARQSRPMPTLADIPAAPDAPPPGDLPAEHWTVYELAAEEIEFWQADKDRRHARLRFTRAGSAWSTQRLWP